MVRFVLSAALGLGGLLAINSTAPAATPAPARAAAPAPVYRVHYFNNGRLPGARGWIVCQYAFRDARSAENMAQQFRQHYRLPAVVVRTAT